MQRHLMWIPIVLGVIAAAGCNRQAAAPGNETAPANAPSQQSGTAVSGQALYLQNCASCHGAQGDTIPTFRQSVQGMTQSQIEQTVSNGQGTMPAFKDKLTQDQIKTVAAYTKGLATGAPPANTTTTTPPANTTTPAPGVVPTPPPANTTTPGNRTAAPPGVPANQPTGSPSPQMAGQTVFTNNCASCHGAQGELIPGWRKAVSKMPLAQVEKTVSNGKGSMPAFKQKLTAAQITAVAQYAKHLAGMTSTATSSVKTAYTKNCQTCHGANANQPPNFRATVKGMSLSQVEQVIRTGKGGMPGFQSKLSSQQVTSLAQYVKQQAGTTTGAAGTGKPGQQPPGAAGATGPTGATTTASGATVYAVNCQGCHGAKANQPAGFDAKLIKMPVAQIEQTIRKGKGGMPGFASKLSAPQIAAVAQYLKSTAGPSTPAATVPKPVAAVSGMTVFNANCQSCHGAKGNQPPNFASTVKGMSLAQVEQMIRKGKDGMPAFGSKLSAAQVTAAAQYTKQLAGGG